MIYMVVYVTNCGLPKQNLRFRIVSRFHDKSNIYSKIFFYTSKVYVITFQTKLLSLSIWLQVVAYLIFIYGSLIFPYHNIVICICSLKARRI